MCLLTHKHNPTCGKINREVVPAVHGSLFRGRLKSSILLLDFVSESRRQCVLRPQEKRATPTSSAPTVCVYLSLLTRNALSVTDLLLRRQISGHCHASTGHNIQLVRNPSALHDAPCAYFRIWRFSEDNLACPRFAALCMQA
jgi:hypothetical protein